MKVSLRLFLTILILLFLFTWQGTQFVKVTLATEPTLETLQESRTKAIEFRNNNETSLLNAQNTLKSATNPEEMKSAQEAVKKAQASLAEANRSVADADAKLEASPQMKVKRLTEYYDQLGEASIKKGKELSGKVTKTTEEADIKAQQIAANESYTGLIYAKKHLEVCQLQIPVCDLKDSYQKDVNDVSATLRKQVSALTLAEEKINRGMKFEVSRIFSPVAIPEGQTARTLTFLEFTNKIADWMITLVSSLAVTALIIGGFMMIISGGAEERLEMGKTIFTYSLIGLAVTLLAYGIIATIQSLFI